MVTAAGYLSFWAGAIALAGAAIAHYALAGRTLGVSGVLERGLAPDDGRFAGADPSQERLEAFAFLGAIAIGAFVAALLRGGPPALSFDLGPAHAAIFGGGLNTWLAAFFGGGLVGVGTRLAQGCTSGHGLVGCAGARPSSLVATACFFGTGIVFSLLLAAVAS
jgi:uncharacterized membrane protein YedE/YeeE